MISNEKYNLAFGDFNDFVNDVFSAGGAQVVTESQSHMSQFAALEQKQTRHEIYQVNKIKHYLKQTQYENRRSNILQLPNKI